MTRREFIAGLGGAAVLPVAARAQQSGRMRQIGVLITGSESDPDQQYWLAASVQELARLGWIDGRNLRIDRRFADDIDRIRKAAKELVALQPDVILTASTPATAAVQRETRTIPIGFAPVVDPVGSGFVAGLPRPGGNLTGFQAFEGSIAGKWLQMIKEIAPRIRRAAAMYNPDAAPFAEYQLGAFRTAAQALSVDAIVAPVRHDAEIESVIDSLGREQAGLVSLSDAYMSEHRATVIAAVTRNDVPAIYSNRQFPRDGGLLSYGPSFPDMFRLAAGYVDRILKGDKPSDLPVQAPTKYELTINLKTAKALGVMVPLKYLATADELIE